VGVIDGRWWSLWWPWLVVWALTAVCWGVLLWYTLVRLGWVRSRRRRSRRTVLGMCFYLHEPKVKSLAETGGISDADEQDVVDTTNETRGFGLWAKLGVGDAGAHRDVTKERVTAYLKQNTPMKVIRLIMDRMREEDVIVHADLTTGLVVPNGGLSETLRESDADQVPLTAVMSEFVSVTGRFTADRSSSGEIVLRARYGDGERPAHVKITCEAVWVREEFQGEDYFTGEFHARCLGKVRTWNRQAGELTLDPIAIFH
jgi:hypothetical protein